jgi:hypothetical protein
MLKTIRKKSNLIFLLLSVILAFPSVVSLLHAGFPLTDDGNWMVIRFSAFYESLRAGQIPVRFLMRLNNGFGYPVADFLYPLFMYFSTPIHILKIGFADSIKVLLVISLISSGLFSFLWLRKLFDNVSSLVGSVFYVYFPYHLFDVYKRGSVGEVLSLAILPFILWQIERKSLLFTSLGIALLILAHNTLAFMFIVFLLIYMGLNIYISKDKKSFIYQYLFAMVLGFGISAFFWIPAIFDLKYTVFSTVKISDFAKYFSDINLIGIPSVLVMICIILLFAFGKLQIKKHRLTVVMFVIGLFSIVLSTSLSSIIWNLLPVSFIQFPFRFLSLAIVCVSFMAASIFSVFKGSQKIIIAAVAVAILFIFSYPYMQVKTYQYLPDTFYSTNQDTTTVKNEYMPKWVKQELLSGSWDKVQNITGKEKISITESSANKTRFSVKLEKPQEILVNTVYYPGWTTYSNNSNIDINYNDGLIKLNLPKGQNDVKVVFKETTFRLICDLVSVVSLVVLFGSYLIFRKKGYNL